MVKVLYRPSGSRFLNNHALAIFRLESHLAARNVYFDEHGFDVVWCHAMPYIEPLVELHKPMIIQDLHMGPELYWYGIRQLIEQDCVKVVVKSSIYADLSDYDRKFQGNLFHVHRINDAGSPECYPDEVSQSLDKLHLLWCLAAYDRYRKRLWPEPNFVEERRYDVCMALGDVTKEVYPDEAVRVHRFQALDAITALRFRTLCRYPFYDGRWSGQYWFSLRNSKICVCPWGFDPITFREYEAALCGAVVVRPDTSYCTTWPEIPYTRCADDFSDLHAVVSHIVCNFGRFEGQRRQAYESARYGLNDGILAGRVVELVERCL